MKLSRRQALLAGGTVLMSGCLGATAQREDIAAKDDIFTVAHRGSMYLRPENTLSAIEHAIETGADMVEIDLDVTAEGTIVLMHDSTVDRTTDGEGRINDFRLLDMKRLDAGYRFPPEFDDAYVEATVEHDHLPPTDPEHPFRGEGIEVPTLREVFEAVPNDYPLLLDLKRERPSPARLADLIAEFDRAEATLIGAFETPYLQRIRSAMPDVPTGLGASEVRQFLATANANEPRYDPPAEFLFAPYGTVTESRVRRAHRNGLTVLAFTVNDPEEMERLIDAGVDGILTDDHVFLEQVRESSDRVRYDSSG